MTSDEGQRPDLMGMSVGKGQLAVAYPVGCFVALLAMLVAATLAIDSSSNMRFGWDIRVNCAAVDAHRQELDPYFVKNLKGTKLSYPYLPVTLDIFRPLCSTGLLASHYRSIYLVLAVVCGLLLPGLGKIRWSLRAIFLRVLCALGAFVGFEWTQASGNFTIFSGLLTAVALALLIGRSPFVEEKKSFILRVAGAAVLGVLTSFKLVFCPVLVSLYFLPQPRSRKLMLIAVAVGMFIFPILISRVFYADLFASWLSAISGQIPEQHSVALNETNPSLLLLGFDLAEHLGLAGNKLLAFTLYGLAATALILAPFAWAVSRMTRNDAASNLGGLPKRLDQWLLDHPREAARITVLAMYALYLCSPRLKEYAFFELAIYAAVLIVDLSPMAMMAALTAAILIPVSASMLGSAIEGTFLQLGSALVCFWVLLLDFRGPQRA
jgi:hypothetical protein